MSSALPVTGDHLKLLRRVGEYIRDPSVSDEAAFAVLEDITTIAFRDGVTAAMERTLADIRLIQTEPATAGKQ